MLLRKHFTVLYITYLEQVSLNFILNDYECSFVFNHLAFKPVPADGHTFQGFLACRSLGIIRLA